MIQQMFSKFLSLKFGYFFQLNTQVSIWSSKETAVIRDSSFADINPPGTVGTTNPALYLQSLVSISPLWKLGSVPSNKTTFLL